MELTNPDNLASYKNDVNLALTQAVSVREEIKNAVGAVKLIYDMTEPHTKPIHLRIGTYDITIAAEQLSVEVVEDLLSAALTGLSTALNNAIYINAALEHHGVRKVDFEALVPADVKYELDSYEKE